MARMRVRESKLGARGREENEGTRTKGCVRVAVGV